MSYSVNDGLDQYRHYLDYFQDTDLQALLGAFDSYNKNSRNTYLKGRALELISCGPPGFNQPAYLKKIMEMYQTIISGMPNTTINAQQQQTQLNINTRPKLKTNHSPQYNKQPVAVTEDGLHPDVTQICRTLCRIANADSVPRSNRRVGIPSFLYPFDPIPFVVPISMNGPRSTPSLGNAKFKKLPFFEVVADIMEPINLIGEDRCTLPNDHAGMREAVFNITLSMDQVNLISLNRESFNGEYDYLYQFQIRICDLEAGSSEITDCLPYNLCIRINSRTCLLPPTESATPQTIQSKLIPRPIDCTDLIKLNPNVSNSIFINWTPDLKHYIIGFYLVKKLSTDNLLQQLIEKGKRSSDETKNYIIQKTADVDPDLATTSFRFSLMCPLSKMRMKLPAKSIKCDHLQCFDANTFILMNEKKPTWRCPSCNNPCLYDDILIESYFLDILSSSELTDCNKEIEILSDGSWRIFEENGNSKNAEDGPEKITVDLDTDDSNHEIPLVVEEEPNSGNF